MKYSWLIKRVFLTLFISSSLIFWIETLWFFYKENTFYQDFGFSAFPMAITLSLLLLPCLIVFKFSENTRPRTIWGLMLLPVFNIIALGFLLKGMLQLMG